MALALVMSVSNCTRSIWRFSCHSTCVSKRSQQSVQASETVCWSVLLFPSVMVSCSDARSGPGHLGRMTASEEGSLQVSLKAHPTGFAQCHGARLLYTSSFPTAPVRTSAHNHNGAEGGWRRWGGGAVGCSRRNNILANLYSMVSHASQNSGMSSYNMNWLPRWPGCSMLRPP